MVIKYKNKLSGEREQARQEAVKLQEGLYRKKQENPSYNRGTNPLRYNESHEKVSLNLARYAQSKAIAEDKKHPERQIYLAKKLVEAKDNINYNHVYSYLKKNEKRTRRNLPDKDELFRNWDAPIAKYRQSNLIDDLITYYTKLSQIIGGLKGKKIIDIGCGSQKGFANNTSYLGAKVIGIDIEPPFKYTPHYQHIQANLKYSDINFLLPRGFKPDLIHASAFFDDPDLLRSFKTEEERIEFNRRMCEQVAKALKTGGVFITEDLFLNVGENLNNFMKKQGLEYEGEFGQFGRQLIFRKKKPKK